MRSKRKTKEKPVLVKCGNNFINPEDVSCIKNVKRGELWIVKFKSEPNPDFPCWLNDEEEVIRLLEYFTIVE